jgi:hypothetical protein
MLVSEFMKNKKKPEILTGAITDVSILFTETCIIYTKLKGGSENQSSACD